MKIEEALLKIGNNCIDAQYFYSPFYVYSCLCDYCYDSYDEMEKARLFFSALKKVNIFEIYLKNGFEIGKEEIEYSYQSIKSEMRYELFYEFVNICENAIKNIVVLTEKIQELDYADSPFIYRTMPENSIMYLEEEKELYHLDKNCSAVQSSSDLVRKITYDPKKVCLCKECRGKPVEHEEEGKFLLYRVLYKLK